MALLRLGGALIGFFFGFYLGAALLEVSQVTTASNQVLVVFLLATACAILGWLGAPYLTVVPARWTVRRIREASAGDLLGGAFGAGVGLILALLLAIPLAFLPGDIGRIGPLVAAVTLGACGTIAGMMKRHELITFIREIRVGRRGGGGDRLLLDTSVIIDGRIGDIVKSGFVRGTLLVPRFILHELQYFADSGDGSRRERGRRGLEILQKMQKEPGVTVELSDADPADASGADAKLVSLARTLGVPIMTNDYGLNRVAELQGVKVLNVNDLAKAVRPVVLPGEDITVRVAHEGKESGQGIGYLEDGTMIVIENGARSINAEVTVHVMRVLQTVGGRMIFAQPKGEVAEPRRPRAVNPGA